MCILECVRMWRWIGKRFSALIQAHIDQAIGQGFRSSFIGEAVQNKLLVKHMISVSLPCLRLLSVAHAHLPTQAPSRCIA